MNNAQENVKNIFIIPKKGENFYFPKPNFISIYSLLYFPNLHRKIIKTSKSVSATIYNLAVDDAETEIRSFQ
jgi:hypothetical protein